MACNCSETTVQLDDQEQPVEMEQRRLTEPVKKFSSFAKSSASRIDFRKSFLPGLKSPTKPVLQPWPSATNISRSVPFIQTPFPTSIEAEFSLRRDSFKSMYHRSSVEESDGRPSISSQDERYEDSIVNSMFAKEKLYDVPDIYDCDNAEKGHDALESGLSRCQCKQVCQELPILRTINTSVTDGEPSRIVDSHTRINNSKYLMAKSDRSPDKNFRKRKSIQWRPRISGETLKFRRRTTDSIPKMNTTLIPTRSTPNLSNLEEPIKTALNIKTDPFYEQEDNSKLWSILIRLVLVFLFRCYFDVARRNLLTCMAISNVKIFLIKSFRFFRKNFSVQKALRLLVTFVL